jgi:hypothetical protein
MDNQLTFTDIINKYFKFQNEATNNLIDEEISDDNIEDLTDIYGFEVIRGSKIYRYFIKNQNDVYQVKYFSSTYRYPVLNDIVKNNLKFLGDRLGIPVFTN